MMNTELKTMANRTIETLASLPTRAARQGYSPKSTASKIMNPHRDQWERKWIGLDCYHPAISLMATEARKFTARWFNKNPNPSLLVLAGHTGCGKSHTLHRIMSFARSASFAAFQSGNWRNIPSTHMLHWPSAVDSLRKQDDSWLSNAFNSDLLALDEIGGADDPWQSGTDKLCQILTRRENLFTIATTNIEPAAWEEKFDVRIADRFLRNSVIVDLTEVQSYALKD